MDKKRTEGRRPATPIISRRRGLIVAGGTGRRRAGTTQRSHPVDARGKMRRLCSAAVSSRGETQAPFARGPTTTSGIRFPLRVNDSQVLRDLQFSVSVPSVSSALI